MQSFAFQSFIPKTIYVFFSYFFITFSSPSLLIFYFLLPFQYLSHLSPLQSNVQNPCGSLYTLKVFQTLRSSLTRRFSHIVCSSPAEFHGEGFWKRQYPYIHEYLFEEAIRVESSFPMQGLSTVIDRELLVVIPATFISWFSKGIYLLVMCSCFGVCVCISVFICMKCMYFYRLYFCVHCHVSLIMSVSIRVLIAMYMALNGLSLILVCSYVRVFVALYVCVYTCTYEWTYGNIRTNTEPFNYPNSLLNSLKK